MRLPSPVTCIMFGDTPTTAVSWSRGRPGVPRLDLALHEAGDEEIPVVRRLAKVGRQAALAEVGHLLRGELSVLALTEEPDRVTERRIRPAVGLARLDAPADLERDGIGHEGLEHLALLEIP